MQATIYQYNIRIAEISNNYENGINYMQLSNITGDICELDMMQTYLQDTIEKIKKIKHNIDTKYKNIKNNVISTDSSICTYTDDLIINDELFNKTKDNNIIEVNSMVDIPISPVYWIKSIKQYGINIGGMILRGNIGNIYNANITKQMTDIYDLIYCKNENLCEKILSGCVCKYYHDPQQLLELNQRGLINDTIYRNQLRPKNFINTSWIYTDYPEKKSNINMRHFGSRDTLKHFIQLTKIENTSRTKSYIRNYKDQCAHDILVLYALYVNNL